MSERQPPIDVPSNAELLESILTVEGSFGDSYSRFHAYSLRNIGFLAMQGCPPEPVATFKRWQELGYHVKKGERAYSILRPITVKVKGDESEAAPAAEAEPDKPRVMRRFKVVRALFHYAQVAGEGELPPYVPPNWDEARALETLNITEEPFALYNGNVMGYSYDRTIAVSPVAPYPFKTKVHELGHVVSGHTEDASDDEDVREAMHQGINEFQAESTAYLTLHQLGAEDQMDTSESRAYVQSYLRGHQPSEVDVRQVFSAADKIVRAGQISIDPTE
ncbi:ArdC family protein [Rathayibacter oskolensis]|uniref:ArdC family protein n=1 Tax=Rathayibacter oskolensis TaxID=1891671 RepID=UPI00265D7F38|nr:ArdC family protein [Rathayibacter oskolensis]WKK71482.1 ArdC family protein [Rathayibacter oskolensis]